MLTASCLMLEIKEFRCYEARIEESEKGVEHFWLEPPVLCHWATTTIVGCLAVMHIEDCKGCWLSSRCGSVAEDWQLKPEVSWVQVLPPTASLFPSQFLPYINYILLEIQAHEIANPTIKLLYRITCIESAAFANYTCSVVWNTYILMYNSSIPYNSSPRNIHTFILFVLRYTTWLWLLQSSHLNLCLPTTVSHLSMCSVV